MGGVSYVHRSSTSQRFKSVTLTLTLTETPTLTVTPTLTLTSWGKRVYYNQGNGFNFEVFEQLALAIRPYHAGQYEVHVVDQGGYYKNSDSPWDWNNNRCTPIANPRRHLTLSALTGPPTTPQPLHPPPSTPKGAGVWVTLSGTVRARTTAAPWSSSKAREPNPNPNPNPNQNPKPLTPNPNPNPNPNPLTLNPNPNPNPNPNANQARVPYASPRRRTMGASSAHQSLRPLRTSPSKATWATWTASWWRRAWAMVTRTRTRTRTRTQARTRTRIRTRSRPVNPNREP